MKDKDKTKEQLLDELGKVRQKLRKLEAAEGKRKQTEQILKESEEKYKSIFESFQDVYYRTDREGRITIISPSVYTQAGYNPKEMIGQSVTDFYLYPSDREDFLQEIKKSGALNDYELKLKAKDGRVIDASVSSRIMIGKDGEPVGVEGVLRNITERKKMEEELIRLSTAVKMSVDGVIIADLDAKIIDVNEAVLKKHGFKHKEEMIGKNSFQFVAPEDREKLLPAIKKMTNKGYIVGVEYHILTKEGRKIPVEANGVILRGEDGKPKGFVATVRDVTERKQAEEALRESEEKFKNIFESASDCMVLVNRTGRILDVNKKAVEVFGGSKKEIQGKHFTKLGILSPTNIKKVISAFRNTLGGKKSDVNVVIKNKKGQEITLECSGTFMRGEEKSAGILIIARDVTERKKVEDALKESEEKYREIVELAPDGILTINLKGVITSCNTAFSNLAGTSKGNIVGKHFTKLPRVRPRDIPKYIKMFNALVRGKSSQSLELEWHRKDGTTRIGELHVSLIKKGRKTIGIQVIARDITERKRSEEALKESEEKFRNLAEQSPNMIFINKKGKVVYANKKCEEMMEYKREEFYSADFNFMTLVAPESRGIVQESFTKHRRGKESLPYEYALITKKGKRIEAILTSKLINYEGEKAILGIVTDITEHKIAEEKYHSLYSAMNEGVCLHEIIHDDKGKAVDYRITDVNPAYESITGLKKEKVVGIKASEFYRTDNPPFLNIYAKVAETREPASIETYFPPLKKYFIISVFSPEKGKFATVYTDITERYNTERELIEAKDQAETALKKLKRVQSQLIQSERLAALGKLSAGIAHEINNPLSIISGHTQILLMEKISGQPELQKTLKIIKKQVDRASSITDQLLQFSKRIKPKLKKSDVNEVLKDTLTLLKQQLVQDKIRTVPQLSSKPVFIKADSLQLQQVFLNLIINASHAMPNGGTLSISTMVKDANFEIIFTDTGCGIPEENLSKLFEPFFSTKENGAGLGLSIAYGIIKAHKGDITVKSKEGEGTTFTITLPYE